MLLLTLLTLEENTDPIWGYFRFHGLDPKPHNLRPSEEESDEVDGELDEAEDEVDAEGHENATQHEEERLADSFDNVILQFVNDALEVKIETIWSEQVQKAGEILLVDGIDCSELPILVPHVETQVELEVETQVSASQEVEDNQNTQSLFLNQKVKVDPSPRSHSCSSIAPDKKILFALMA